MKNDQDTPPNQKLMKGERPPASKTPATKPQPAQARPADARPINHSYEKATGRLHADNPHHPGITEADIEQVLDNLALIEQDERKLWKWKATGPTKGKYAHLTVVYYVKQGEVNTITAHPPNAQSLAEYLRLKKEGKLWTPAVPTPKKT